MPKFFKGYCPVCESEKLLTTMDKPIGSACRCSDCNAALSVTGKNQIMTLPFFVFVCYLIFYLPSQGRMPTGVELIFGFITLVLFTLYNKMFVVYRAMDKDQ